jgi:hypothetical protein
MWRRTQANAGMHVGCGRGDGEFRDAEQVGGNHFVGARRLPASLHLRDKLPSDPLMK